MNFVIYRDTRGQYRWRLKAQNGYIIADSAEGYVNKGDCQKGIDLVKSTNALTPVVDTTHSTFLGR